MKNERNLNRDYILILSLIERVQNNDSEAGLELYQYFKNKIDYHVNKWGSTLKCNEFHDDIIEVAVFAIYTGTRDYRGNSSLEYFHYINTRIDSRVNAYMYKEMDIRKPFAKITDSEIYDNMINNISDGQDYESYCLNAICYKEVYRQIYDELNEQDRELYRLLLLKNVSYEEIEKKFNISNEVLRQRKSRLYKKIRKTYEINFQC